MDNTKLKMADVANLTVEKLIESEQTIRRELAMLRLDIYSPKGSHTGKKRNLRKSLARVLTEKNKKAAN